MWPYVVTLAVYILSYPLVFYISGSHLLSLAFKVALTAACLIYYRKDYRMKLTPDILAVATGIAIFIIWVGLDGYYPLIGSSLEVSYDFIGIILKLVTGILFAPIIEEFFTRFFLHRWITNKNWQKVKLGTYTHASFIFTVLFFGFSHDRWLAGIITGILLNLLFYKRKNIESCVVAHAVANSLLAAYVLYTGSFQFW